MGQESPNDCRILVIEILSGFGDGRLGGVVVCGAAAVGVPFGLVVSVMNEYTIEVSSSFSWWCRCVDCFADFFDSSRIFSNGCVGYCVVGGFQFLHRSCLREFEAPLRRG